MNFLGLKRPEGIAHIVGSKKTTDRSKQYYSPMPIIARKKDANFLDRKRKEGTARNVGIAH